MLIALGLLGGASGFVADVAFADDGPGTSPVSVTIPGANGTPTPTPSASSTSGSTSGGTSGSSGSSGSGHSGSSGSGASGGSPTTPSAPGTEPKIPKHPVVGTLKVTITPPRLLRVGDRVTVSVSGLIAGEKVQFVIYYRNGKPVKIGNFTADASGAFTHTITLPKLDAGTDILELTGWDSQKVGTGAFLLGATTVATDPASNRWIWIGVGGLAGIAAFALLAVFGFTGLLRTPAVTGS